MSRAAIRASILHMLPAYLASADLEAESIFRQVGMTVEDVRSPKIVYRSQVNGALALAARTLGSAEVGLSLGAMAEPDRLGPMGAAMKAGATLESCLRAHIAEMPGAQSHVELGLRQEGGSVILTHRLVGDDENAWLLYEGAAAFYVRMLRHLLGDGWTPERASFPHTCRGRRQVYEEFFGAPVVFGRHEEARIVLSREQFAKPLPARRSQIAEADIGRFDAAPFGDFRLGPRDIEIAVSRMIEATLPHKPIRLSDAAALLGLSPRTLQRRLGDHGAVFEQMVDAQRHAAAIKHLTPRGASVTTVAMLLGYSDVAHFNRAFRRWEGLSPTDYRRGGEGERG